MSNTSSRPHASRALDPAFAAKYALAAWQFDSADERRKNAARFTRAGIPADLSAAAAAMSLAVKHRHDLRAPIDRTNPAGDSLPVLSRLRVLVPAIEPNLLYMARGLTRPGPRPSVSTDADGGYRVEWDSPDAHRAATRSLVAYYDSHHEVVRAVAQAGRLDTWHDPFLLIGVRHVYRDDSPTVARWMAADGNARLIGARYAVAADLTRWGIDHPWADPTAYWPADMATLRTVVAASHKALTTNPDLADHWPLSTGVVNQCADFVLPSPDRGTHDIGHWLFHEHNTKTQPDTETFPLSEPAANWLAGLDYFRGIDADDFIDIVSADPMTHEGREEIAAIEEEIAKFLTDVTANKDVTAARLALAATALAATPADQIHWPVSEDWAKQPFTHEEWFVKGALFRDYTARATRRCRESDYLFAAGINTVRQHLTATRTFPTGDLYGVWGDLSDGLHGGALTDPSSEWFTLTAMWGIAYAALHGHIWFTEDDTAAGTKASAEEQQARNDLFTALPMSVRVLLDTSAGQEVLVYYAEQASRGLVPEDRVQPVTKTMATKVRALAQRLLDDAADNDTNDARAGGESSTGAGGPQ